MQLEPAAHHAVLETDATYAQVDGCELLAICSSRELKTLQSHQRGSPGEFLKRIQPRKQHVRCPFHASSHQSKRDRSREISSDGRQGRLNL